MVNNSGMTDFSMANYYLQIYNSIIWNNTISLYTHHGEDVPTLIEYSCVQNGQNNFQLSNGDIEWGVGNIEEYPNFADSSSANFSLAENSVCIDAGNPHTLYNDDNGTRNDIGAYEQAGVMASIKLNKGWNVISFNVLGADSSFSAIFKDVIDSISVVKTTEGFYYKKNQEFLNNLEVVEIGTGYLVYAIDTSTISYEGHAVTPSDYTLHLEKGLNIIGIPYSEAVDIETVFGTAIEYIDLIKSFNGFFEPNNQLSSFTQFEPHKGYFIFVNSDCEIEW